MEPFAYVPEFRIIVYKDCGLAVLLGEVNAYLRGRNHRLDASSRRSIVAAVKERKEDLIRDSAQLKAQFETPLRPVRAI